MSSSEAREPLGETFLKVAFRAIGAAFPGGAIVEMAVEQLAGPFCRAGWAWLQAAPPAQRQAALGDVASMTPQRAAELARLELQGAKLSENTKRLLIDYLAYIPARTRQRLCRFDDVAGVNTLLSQLPMNEQSLAQYLPLRMPAFRAGHRIPHHDFQLEALFGQGGFGEVWRAASTRAGSTPGRSRQNLYETDRLGSRVAIDCDS